MRSGVRDAVLLVLGAVLGFVANPLLTRYAAPAVFGADGRLLAVAPPVEGWSRDAYVDVETEWLSDGHAYFLVIRIDDDDPDGSTYFPQIEVGAHTARYFRVQLGRRVADGGADDVGMSYEVLLYEVWGTTLDDISRFMGDIRASADVAALGMKLDAPRFESSKSIVAGPIVLVRGQI